MFDNTNGAKGTRGGIPSADSKSLMNKRLGNKKDRMSSADTGRIITEEEGFEPPVPCGTAVFKTALENSEPQKNKELTNSLDQRLQISLQDTAEKEQNQADSMPSDLNEIVKAWPELPEHIKQAMQALARPYNEKEKG